MKLKIIVSILAGFILFGCAQQQKSTSPASASAGLSDKIIDARLAETAADEPVLLSSNDADFFVYAYNNRLYVVGSKSMADKFVKQHHLPYTRTILGLGPKGETVVFEVQKKKPAYVARLQQKYESAPALLKAKENFWVWKYNGRIYVIGQQKTNEAFKMNHHLPYTKTILGLGPQGETVIFEVNKKDPSLAESLRQQF